MGDLGLGSVSNGELRKLVACGLPLLGYIRDMGARRAFAAPGEQLLEAFLLALCHDLHAAVLRVSDPADQPHGGGRLLRIHSEEYALNVAGNFQVKPLHSCGMYP